MLTYAGVESSLDEFEKMLLEMDGEPLAAAGTHFTGFTSTNILRLLSLLVQACIAWRWTVSRREMQVLTLLALLGQQYKY